MLQDLEAPQREEGFGQDGTLTYLKVELVSLRICLLTLKAQTL